MADFKSFIAKVAASKALTFEEAREAFDIVMSGEATPSQIGGFLMALRVRGETVPEIMGAIATMRDKMLRVDAPANAIDIVGTGGDGQHSLNISTGSAFVIAGHGVPVAKHGNRNLSSQSGAADVLMALGIRIDLAPDAISRCISEAGIGFMFAPAHHPAMKYVGPSRVELGTRTIFNILGPLSNPGGVRRQLVGVFASEWVRPIADALKELGAESAAYHEALGRSLVLRPEDRLFVIGEQAHAVCAGALQNDDVSKQLQIVSTLDPVRAALAAWTGAVFVKGSRKYRLETILENEPAAAAH